MIIYKYELRFINNKCTVSIPAIHKILHLKVVNYIPIIWCMVDQSSDLQQHEFIVYGTGCEIDIRNSESYVGSYQISGAHTYHVFHSCQY